MYKKITKDNKIFKSTEFLNDKYKYYIACQILDGDDPIIYSNEKDYFLIRSSNSHPVWIWTRDDIDKSLVREIEEVIKLFLVNDIKDKFTCKKEFYDLLVKDNFHLLNTTDYFEMNSLHCEKTKEPKKSDGNINKATLDDLEILTEYWYQDNLETSDNTITLENAKKDVLNMINKGTTYVLRNKNDKIVCMSSYTTVDNLARINHVFTPKEERGKAYCANLIYRLSNMLLNNNLIPMLYTDYNYIPSNKSYMNVGYISDGVLISFSCSKEDLR